MMNEEYHKPFIKNMILVAVFTLVAMFSSKFIIEIYSPLLFSHQKISEYSSQKSQDETKQPVDN